MDYPKILQKFEIFYSDIYNKQLIKSTQENASVVVDYEDLEKFDPDLADILLDDPITAIKAAEEAIFNIISSNLEIPGFDDKNRSIAARFYNLPEISKIMISNLRSKHLLKFISLVGNIKQASQVRPEITSATWECQMCGQRTLLLQDEPNLTKPYMCECGNKRSFTLVERKLIDIQKIVLQESPEDIDSGHQAQKINVYIKNDLVDPSFRKNVTPGNKVTVTGTLFDLPVRIDRGSESKTRNIFLDGNFIVTEESNFEEIEITKDDIKIVKQLAEDKKVFEKIASSIAPSIFGYHEIKEAIALQLFSGVRKVREDKSVSRGDIHILLVGDPGAGKSQILKFITELSPKGRYVVGKSASGAGLTAAAIKDEITGEWALEAGALVLANGGLVAIDEMDKMSEEDRSAMHEAMAQQTVTVSKANIQATLPCKTIILAAANPKYSRFDPYEAIAGQINLPESLLSRFDLIFAILDTPNRERDSKIAGHILELHKSMSYTVEPPISSDLMKKYISYARNEYNPVLTTAAMDRIQQFYIKLRNKGGENEEKGSSVSITPRQLEALVRLSEASARVRLSTKVQKQDADRAINLITFCMKELGTDPETGEFDIDRLTGGTPSSKRSKITRLLMIINDFEKELGEKEIPEQDIYARAEEEGMDEFEVKKILSQLRQEGTIFDPKPGFLRRV